MVGDVTTPYCRTHVRRSDTDHAGGGFDESRLYSASLKVRQKTSIGQKRHDMQ